MTTSINVRELESGFLAMAARVREVASGAVRDIGDSRNLRIRAKAVRDEKMASISARRAALDAEEAEVWEEFDRTMAEGDMITDAVAAMLMPSRAPGNGAAIEHRAEE